MCNMYLGVVGGVYAGMEYSLERARGKQDWVSLVPLVINMLILLHDSRPVIS